MEQINDLEYWTDEINDLEDWTKEINDLEKHFKSIELPNRVRLNRWTMIEDVKLFISSHLQTLKARNGASAFNSHLSRLNELKEVLSIILIFVFSFILV